MIYIHILVGVLYTNVDLRYFGDLYSKEKKEVR